MAVRLFLFCVTQKDNDLKKKKMLIDEFLSFHQR